MGARPLRRGIQRFIEDPLADFVLGRSARARLDDRGLAEERGGGQHREIVPPVAPADERVTVPPQPPPSRPEADAGDPPAGGSTVDTAARLRARAPASGGPRRSPSRVGRRCRPTRCRRRATRARGGARSDRTRERAVPPRRGGRSSEGCEVAAGRRRQVPLVAAHRRGGDELVERRHTSGKVSGPLCSSAVGSRASARAAPPRERLSSSSPGGARRRGQGRARFRGGRTARRRRDRSTRDTPTRASRAPPRARACRPGLCSSHPLRG